MKPWMRSDEVLLYESLIAARDPERCCDVLEWGAGGSTAHFSRVLERVGCPRSWLAIDHAATWVARARERSPAWVEFLHVATSGDRCRPELWAGYIDPPALAERRFDLILIDGRMRRRCLERAATLLRDDEALVILHDAQRPYYHAAFGRLAQGRFLSKRVWVAHRRAAERRDGAPMKVFGIGLSRTGTKSLNAALRVLGFDVHHYPTDPITAHEVLDGRPYSILDRSDGLTDIHAAVRFGALDAQYPGSRFILTTRDKTSWLESCRRHFAHYRPETKPQPLRAMILSLRRQMYGVEEFREAVFLRTYDRHKESALAHFQGRDSLLILDITAGDGWNALCPFLDRPDPGQPFPFLR